MSTRTLTPEEETAYAELAAAAKRLREAQEKSRRLSNDQRGTAAMSSGNGQEGHSE